MTMWDAKSIDALGQSLALAQQKLDAMAEQIASLKGMVDHLVAMHTPKPMDGDWIKPQAFLRPALDAVANEFRVRAKEYKPRGDRPPKDLGYAGRAELPPSKPEYATVPPWEGPDEFNRG